MNILIANDDINPVDEKKKKKAESVTASSNTFKAIAEEYVLEQMKYRGEDYVEQF